MLILGALVSASCAGPNAPTTDAGPDAVPPIDGGRDATTSDLGDTERSLDLGYETSPLVRSDLWEVLPADEDPFVDHRPMDVVCEPDGFVDEDGSLEVSTDLCPYVSARQPSLAPVRSGDILDVEFWHLLLASNEPAEAHASIMVGDHVAFEWEIPIPSDANAYTESIEVDWDAPEGTPITFHLHNHGYNTWKLNALRVNTRVRPN